MCKCELPFGLQRDAPQAPYEPNDMQGTLLSAVPEWGHKVQLAEFPHPFVAGYCWIFTGRINRNGYGRVWCASTKAEPVAHRHLWTRLYGEIPKDLVLDHLCFNRMCVNPAHLEPVTSRVNTLRGKSILFKKVC